MYDIIKNLITANLYCALWALIHILMNFYGTLEYLIILRIFGILGSGKQNTLLEGRRPLQEGKMR